jgi:hypothetical protein
LLLTGRVAIRSHKDGFHTPKKECFWPRSSAHWPSGIKIDKIKATGIHDVATDPFYWKLSFVSCEKELLKDIDINGTCRKKTQRIMKMLKEYWCPKGKKQELTSYHLKNGQTKFIFLAIQCLLKINTNCQSMFLSYTQILLRV